MDSIQTDRHSERQNLLASTYTQYVTFVPITKVMIINPNDNIKVVENYNHYLTSLLSYALSSAKQFFMYFATNCCNLVGGFIPGGDPYSRLVGMIVVLFRG